MTRFRDRLGVSTSYVHSLERDAPTPAVDRAQRLAEVFAEVAELQGADPANDVRALMHAREVAVLMEDLEIDEGLAELLVAVREVATAMGPDPALQGALQAILGVPVEQRDTVTTALEYGVPLLEALPSDIRAGALRNLAAVSARIGTLDPEERRAVAMEYAQAFADATAKIESAAPSSPELAPAS